MPSLIPGFEYDIFISYRQKDNKHDGWVTEFVNNLKGELEATFKEDVSVYFDINPHDGLLESHEVGDSLKEKLKCLIFIPIISRTYCDPKSFAWEHEFRAFVDVASNDKFGLKVKLPGGNVASRVLPVRIYDLNNEDLKLCESVLGGPLRGIEFIYKSAGVNRPLRAKEDNTQDNLNRTFYRDQINKMSHSIQEIIQGLRAGPATVSAETIKHFEAPREILTGKSRSSEKKLIKLKWLKILSGVLATAALVFLIIMSSGLFKKDRSIKLNSREILDRAISICDPYKSWNDYSGRIHLGMVMADGKVAADETIEISTKEDYYKCISKYYDSVKIVKGIKNGQIFREINGNKNPGDELIKQHGLDSLSVLWFKEHHYCHFGFLMELKNSALVLDEKVRWTKFQGENCLTIKFTGDTGQVKKYYFKGNTWTVYIDPDKYSVRGWKLESKKDKEGFAILSGNLRVNNINIPLYKAYYSNIDSSFLAIDLFTYAKE